MAARRRVALGPDRTDALNPAAGGPTTIPGDCVCAGLARCPIAALGSDVLCEGVTTVHHTVSQDRPPSISVPAAWAAIAATGTACGLLLSLHVLSPEFSPAWRMISEYANGRYSWVLSAMFTAYGVSMLALAFAIRSRLTTKQGRVGLVLLTLSGIGAASASIFDVNQEALHEVSGRLGYFGLPVPAMLISTAICRLQPWSSAKKHLLLAANLTWVSIVVWIVSFAVMIATFMLALGGLPSAPPDNLPAGVIALVGWTNRLSVLSAWAWVVIVAWHAITLQREAQVSSREIIFPRRAPSSTL
jgi:hypothetical membrane protein